MSKFYVIQVLNTSINDNIGKLHISAGKVSNICISEWQLKQGNVVLRLVLVACHVRIFFDKINPDAVVWNLNQTENYDNIEIKKIVGDHIFRGLTLGQAV